MKFLSITTIAISAVQSCNAFAPSVGKASFGLISSRGNVGTQFRMTDDKIPFFANKDEPEVTITPATSDTATEATTVTSSDAVTEATSSAEVNLDELTFEQEIEIQVEKELKKTKRVSNLRNANGVDYAPWMGIGEEEEIQIRQQVLERTKARRMRQELEKDVSGNLYLDSQAQELSGGGLNFKIIGEEVELEWVTSSETDTKGYIVKRRAAKTDDYETIASFKDYGPLVSKGVDGGLYRYLDTTSTPGGWVYRITECDNNDRESDMCQCLVEVQTAEEQRGALFAAVGIVVIGIIAVVAGLVLDPYAS